MNEELKVCNDCYDTVLEHRQNQIDKELSGWDFGGREGELYDCELCKQKVESLLSLTLCV